MKATKPLLNARELAHQVLDGALQHEKMIVLRTNRGMFPQQPHQLPS